MGIYIERPEQVEAFRFGMEPPPYWFIAKHNACELQVLAPGEGIAQDRRVRFAQPDRSRAPLAIFSPARATESVSISIKCGTSTWRADYGDYIARRANGTVFVMKPAEFAQAYREA